MGLFKKVKNLIKGASSPKGLAGIIAAPVTGGASLTLTAKEAVKEDRRAKAKEAMEEQAVLEAQREQYETEERKKAKLASLSSQGQKVSGIASLIGGQSNTLG